MLPLLLFVVAVCSADFQVEYDWTHINFTWNSEKDYQEAISSGRYIPQNNLLAAVKMYKDNIYFSLTRFRDGTPVTLATMKKGGDLKRNRLLKPFPSWEMNVNETNCEAFYNVQIMEIDKTGIMWVLDGARIMEFTQCPGRLVLLDLNQRGKVIEQFVFPNEICLQNGCWLNDIVLEERFGGFAYITDSSLIDPGLIVYSRNQRKAWKLRDSTMFPDLSAVNFTVGTVKVASWTSIDGIAMAPVPKDQKADRSIFYSPLSSYTLHSISDHILRNETICSGMDWRAEIKLIGRKSSEGSGMIIDNKGNLYYGLPPKYAIAKWNINRGPLNSQTEKIIARNRTELLWPDSFSMDDSGNLYNLANYANRFLINTGPLDLPKTPIIRILKAHTGTKNYLYSKT